MNPVKTAKSLSKVLQLSRESVKRIDSEMVALQADKKKLEAELSEVISTINNYIDLKKEALESIQETQEYLAQLVKTEPKVEKKIEKIKKKTTKSKIEV